MCSGVSQEGMFAPWDLPEENFQVRRELPSSGGAGGELIRGIINRWSDNVPMEMRKDIPISNQMMQYAQFPIVKPIAMQVNPITKNRIKNRVGR